MSDQKPHTVVIGSGAGGLCTALFLAKAGHRVTVLEQGPLPGGCLQSFTRKGEKFETGMHILGSLREGESLHRLWTALGIADKIPVHELDPLAYHVITLGSNKYNFAKGQEAWLEKMGAYFPHQKDALVKYLAAVNEVTTSSSFNNPASADVMGLAKYQAVATNEVIDSLISDCRLRDVLVGDSPLHAPRRNRTPFALHAFLFDFYNRGCYKVKGGSDLIAKVLCDEIRNLGGEVHLNSRVTGILGRDNCVNAVEVNGCQVIACDNVVSAIHPANAAALTATGLLRPAFKKRIASIPNTVGAFTLYMRFKPGAVKYRNSNEFVFNDGMSPWDAENYTLEDWPRGFLFMTNLPADGDSEFASSGVAISYMRSEDTARWEGLPNGRRGEEYEDFKRSKANRLIASLGSHFPELQGDAIESWWSSTPASWLHYTGSPGGSMYGIAPDFTLGAAGRVSYRSKVPNLFFTGQNTNSHGILGVAVGAYMAAAEIIGPQKFSLLDLI